MGAKDKRTSTKAYQRILQKGTYGYKKGRIGLRPNRTRTFSRATFTLDSWKVIPIVPESWSPPASLIPIKATKLPRLSYERSSDYGHTQRINTTSLFQDDASTSPTPIPWNTCTSARKNTAISISKMSNTPFLQYPGPEQDNSGWDTDFATGDSPIGAILDQNLPHTALPCRTLGLMLPDYEISDTAVEADISMPLTPALVEPKREPAATPFLEDIFWDLPVLEDSHPGHP